MNTGVNFYGVNQGQYNAYLEGNKKHEKFVNNLNHNLATAAVAGLAIDGIHRVNKHVDSNVVKTIDSKLTKAANYAATDGLNDLKNVFTKGTEKLKEVFNNIKKYMNNQHTADIPEDIKNTLNNIKPDKKNVFTRLKEAVASGLNKMKEPVKNYAKAAKTVVTNLLNKFAKLPANYKIGGAIGFAALVLTGLISADKNYNNGKIDQKYAGTFKA